MNLFTKVPAWLRGALGTTEPELPHQLDTTGVLPVVDVVQGGYGNPTAPPQVFRLLHAGATAASTVEVLEEHEDEAWLVWAFSVSNNTAGAITFNVLMRDEVVGLSSSLVAPLVAAGASASHVELFGGITPLYVPPRHALRVVCPALLAGENVDFRAVGQRVPRGVRAY